MLHSFRVAAIFAIIFALFPVYAWDGSSDSGKAGQDWPNYLGPNHDNKSLEEGILLQWPASGLSLIWKHTAGEGYALPIIVNKRIYFFDRQGDQEVINCINPENGKLIWKKQYPTNYVDSYGFSNGPRISPIAEQDRLYTFGAEGRLRCWDIRDGTLLWDVDTTKKYGVIQNFFGVGASPVIYKNMIIAQIGGSPADSPGLSTGKTVGNGSAVVAFDKRTGEEVYRLGNELASYAVPTIASLKQRDWCFVFARGGLLTFNPANGKEDHFYPWRAHRLESVNATPPVIFNNQVLITESYQRGSSLLEFSKGGLKELRSDASKSRASLASHWAKPILHNGYLYGSHGMGASTQLRCVKWDTGEVMWEKPGLRDVIPYYVDGHLLLTTENGDLHLAKASPDAYHELAYMEKAVKAPCYNAAVLSHGQLYLLGNKDLKCFRLIPEK